MEFTASAVDALAYLTIAAIVAVFVHYAKQCYEAQPAAVAPTPAQTSPKGESPRLKRQY